MLNARIARLEKEKRFRDWLTDKRFFESWTDQQLEVYAEHGQLPEPLPEALPPGASRLDGMDRKNLIRMWEADEREFAGRTEEELLFYCVHGHWPQQALRNEAAATKATKMRAEPQQTSDGPKGLRNA